MALLIIQTDEARTFPIGNFATVGRDGSNSIVIRHPTVSRTHAKIALHEGTFFLTDTGSTNGTRVNGKPVREPLPLKDGARLRIGHVRAWFFKEQPPHTPQPVATPAAEGNDGGIVFTCVCGTRLWSASDAIGILVACGQCGASNTVPRKSEETDDASSTVAGVVYRDEDPASAAPRTCGVCQWDLEPGEARTLCPSCGLNFHAECWRDNKGCSAYGCDQVNILLKRDRPKFPGAAHGPDADIDTEETYDAYADDPYADADADDDSNRNGRAIAWEYVLLSFAVMGTLLGLFTFGVPAALVTIASVIRLAVNDNDRKPVLAISALLALLGTGAGYYVSRLWWMGVY